MQKLLLSFIIRATWMVVRSTTTSQNGNGCFGFWEYKRMGLQRGTIVGKNTNYKRPYRQCVDKDAPHKDLDKRPYG